MTSKLCICSEYDWRGVDQTLAHHPECRETKPLASERTLNTDPIQTLKITD